MSDFNQPFLGRFNWATGVSEHVILVSLQEIYSIAPVLNLVDVDLTTSPAHIVVSCWTLLYIHASETNNLVSYKSVISRRHLFFLTLNCLIIL